MAVVKSDGYGHGHDSHRDRRAGRRRGWLGVVQTGDALALRQAGLTAPVLCLLAAPDAPHEEAIRGDVDLSAGSVELVGQIAAAAQRAGRPARLHLKADTGMCRGGARPRTGRGWWPPRWPPRRPVMIEITGIWSHLACADMPGHPSIDAQLEAFRDAVALAERAGARPERAAPRQHPGHADAAADLVRPGPAGRRGDRALNAAGRPAGLAAAGHDRAGAAGPGQAGAAGHRGVLRVPVRDHRPDARSGWSRSATPRGCRGTRRASPRYRSAGGGGRSSGTVCMNQFVVDFGDQAGRGRRRGGALRSRRLRASRPPRSGPTRSARCPMTS